MNETTLTRDIALRIGLAVRELEGVSAAGLLHVLANAIGLPPAANKLATLTPKQLKAAAGDLLAEVDGEALKSACALLSGKSRETLVLPKTDPYQPGDMPDSLRVACACASDELLNGHFGSCRYFLVYQVSRDEVRLIDVRPTENCEADGDKNAARAALIADCQVVFVASIGGPAAAKVVRAGIHPIKYPQGGEARARMRELQSRIDNSPPPWLAKAMGYAAEDRVRFQREAAQG